MRDADIMGILAGKERVVSHPRTADTHQTLRFSSPLTLP